MSKKNSKGKSKRLPGVGSSRIVRHGWAVEIARKDDTTFLASSGQGILPAVFAEKRWAAQFIKDLALHGFSCRAVPVTFTDVVPND